MTCDEVKGLLSAYEDRELDLMRSVELETHLAACAGCSALREDHRRLQSEIRGAGLAFAAPRELEARVRAAVRGETRGASGRRVTGALRWAAALAVVGAASWMGGARWARQSPPRTLEAELVSNHVRSLMADHLVDVASSDQHTVKPWFSGKLDFAPPVADYGSVGFPLAGGRLEYIDGRPVAALVYRRGPHLVNVYARPAVDDRTSGIRLGTRQGYNIATWTRAGLA